MDNNLCKCALITGGSRHIGRGIALALAENGYDTAITYASNCDEALETQKQIEALGRRCFIYEAHLDTPKGPEQAVNRARADLGRLDVMVCNAGRDGRHSVLSITAEEMDYMYANTIRNYFLCAGAAARHMVNDGIAGSIIMISSVRGQCAHPEDFFYGSLKAAIDRACKSMALDLSEYSIRVNCIAPGTIWGPDRNGNMPDTPFLRESVPMHRNGSPRDIGEAAVFLAGDHSAYITGVTLLVDGGLSLPSLLEQYDPIPWKSRQWSPKHHKIAMETLKQSNSWKDV